MLDFEAARRERGLTQEEAAQEVGVARGTLLGWNDRLARSGLTPTQRAFFESPDGVKFLTALFVAALFVMNVSGGLGVPMVRTFFTLAGLDTLLACSDSSLLRARRTMIDAIGSWGDIQDALLAKGMAIKDILACVDENFHHGMMLVAMDAVSGFLFVEKFAEHRDGATWATVLREGLKKWPAVRLLALVGDEASGILRCALSELGVLKWSDLFHVLYEVGRGTGAALAHRVGSAQKDLEAAREVLARAGAARVRDADNPDLSVDPLLLATCVVVAAQDVKTAEESLATVKAQQTEVFTAARAFGDCYSPVNLTTGASLDPALITTRLRQGFDAIRAAVQNAGIASGVRVQRSLAKAERVVPSLIAMVHAWHRLAAERIAALGLSPVETAWVWSTLLPTVYLDRVAPKGADKTIRAERRDVATTCAAKVIAPGSPWATWTSDTKARVMAVVENCADLFVRASSCVEGRNGQLSLRHHHTHNLTAALLKALTVIHNYVLTRSDGTTGAERFTGKKHQHLFDHLVTVMPVPARPRDRDAKEHPPLLAAG